MEVSQSTAHLMTPPMSPAILNRGSVINQGPMVLRPSSVGSGLTAHSQASSFSDTIYHNLTEPNQNYFGNGSNYQTMFRTPTQSGNFQHRLEQSRYSQLNDQQITRDYFTSSCAGTPFSTRPSSNYGSSNPQEIHGMQFFNSSGFNVLNGAASGSCQGGTYSSNTSNGNVYNV